MRNRNGGPSEPPQKTPVVIWDWPTRTFHWALVALVAVSFVTGKTGGNAMRYHMWSGYAILALLLFRLIWGFIGGRHARFAAFVRGPAAVWRYTRSLMRSDYVGVPGHNPMGGWSVLAMLAALLLQAGTGLFADDEIVTRGPLNPLVSSDTASLLTLIHLLNQWVIVILIGLHVAAVLFYLVVKRENLIRPMFTGVKKGPYATATPDPPRTAAAIAAAVLSAVLVYFLVR